MVGADFLEDVIQPDHRGSFKGYRIGDVAANLLLCFDAPQQRGIQRALSDD
jgi:hypothetical protein